MNPERWKQVNDLFALAIERAPKQRFAWLEKRCEGDEELRREVESLLAKHDDELLELPVVSAPRLDERLPRDEVIALGTRVGAYEIVRELGRGGMGAVYLAARADLEFQKRVAIKLIRRDMLTALAVRRFRNERQILATLEHPNIARLIDGGTTSEGLPYFVMEYVEGEPLLRYCEAHSLAVRPRLELFLKVCSAVQHAHRRLIVHRDLKPNNILVDRNGAPKLLDFGIAKLLDPESEVAGEESTMTGLRVMTPAYASPEQLRGEVVAIRSDIYSLGIILLELVTGRRPRAAAQTAGQTSRLATEGGSREEHLTRIAARAIHQTPEERYETVEALSTDIESCLAGASVPRYDLSSAGERTRAWHSTDTVSMAVLPLRGLNADSPSDAFLGIGLADAVITKLSNVARITVRPTSTAMRYAETDDPVSAGREMGVDFVLEGRIQKSGNHVRVTVQLVRVESGAPVWASHFDEESQDLLKLEDSISAQVALALMPQLSGEERQRLARKGTANPKAHEAYLQGRGYWNLHTEEGGARALVAFMQAIAADPQYALAHAGVAQYYLQLAVWGGLPPAESFAAAKVAANKALEFDPNLAEAHAALAFALWANDRAFRTAAHHFQMAIALNPDYPQAHQWFGLFHLTRGQPLIAVASMESARKFDPHSQILAISLAFCLYHARQYDRAIEEVRSAIRQYGDDTRSEELLAWCYLAKGSVPECLAAARRSAELSQRGPFSLSALARAEAAAGNLAGSAAIVEELNSRARERHISGSALGSANIGLGRHEEALRLVEQAWEEHDWWTFFVGISPAWDPVRDSPRFQRLAAAIRARELPAVTKDSLPASPRRPRWRTAGVLVAMLLVVLGAGVVFFRLLSHPRPFETTRMAKITTNGTAVRGVISPDGRHVAYVSNENGKSVLWLRKLDSPETSRLAGPMEGDINSINFTNKGADVCFVSSSRSDPDRGVLYLVPLSGGASRKLMTDISTPVAPSADGTRLAFLRRNPEGNTDDLYIARLDGGDQRRIASRHYPERFAWDSLPAWSADGKRVAIGVEGADREGFYVYPMVVDVEDGSTRIVRLPRWQYVERMAWLDRANGLMVIGQDSESSFQHIWYISYPKGEARRINNDLNDYVGVSLTADGTKLVSVQHQTLANLYVSRRNNPSESVQITAGLGRYFDLSWTPEGKIVYASDATGSADIWMMNGDGSGQKQLTAHSARNYAPAVSPDGNWIAFHSNRSGNWNIWRMGLDGADPRALTSDRRDSNWPRFTPDGRYVLYHHTGTNGWNIWRVPLAGGTPVQLTSEPSTHPAVSPKDGRIACWYSQDTAKPSWKLAVLPPAGGAPLRYFDPPATAVAVSALRWTAPGDGITFLDGRNGASNLWIQPVDGGSPRPVTALTSGQIYSFDWSRDGRLVYSHGISSTDIVLIQDTGL